MPRLLMRSCKLCQGHLQLSERQTLSDLLHYFAPLAVLGAIIWYSPNGKAKECAENHLLDDYECCWFSAYVVDANLTIERLRDNPQP